MRPVAGKIQQGRKKEELNKEIPVDGIPLLRHWRCGVISCRATDSVRVDVEL